MQNKTIMPVNSSAERNNWAMLGWRGRKKLSRGKWPGSPLLG